MNKITFLAILTSIIFLAISPLLILLYSFAINAEDLKSQSPEIEAMNEESYQWVNKKVSCQSSEGSVAWFYKTFGELPMLFWKDKGSNSDMLMTFNTITGTFSLISQPKNIDKPVTCLESSGSDMNVNLPVLKNFVDHYNKSEKINVTYKSHPQ